LGYVWISAAAPMGETGTIGLAGLLEKAVKRVDFYYQLLYLREVPVRVAVVGLASGADG
jgi:hypothetical protein